MADLDDGSETFKFNWKQFLKCVGPGLLVSIAYLDPGNSKFYKAKYLYYIKSKIFKINLPYFIGKTIKILIFFSIF